MSSARQHPTKHPQCAQIDRTTAYRIFSGCPAANLLLLCPPSLSEPEQHTCSTSRCVPASVLPASDRGASRPAARVSFRSACPSYKEATTSSPALSDRESDRAA